MRLGKSIQRSLKTKLNSGSESATCDVLRSESALSTKSDIKGAPAEAEAPAPNTKTVLLKLVLSSSGEISRLPEAHRS